MRYPVAVMALLLMLGGCGEDVVHEPVEPLSASPEELRKLYAWEKGPRDVKVVGDLRVPHGVRDETLGFRVYYPTRLPQDGLPQDGLPQDGLPQDGLPQDGLPQQRLPQDGLPQQRLPQDGLPQQRLPLLLFSHGNWSDNASYDNLLLHWVSHGYVVLAPLHRDGGGGYVGGAIDMLLEGNLGVIQARVDDLSTLLGALPAIEALVPALKGRIDYRRIAATGHSFGAFNAQQLGGARTWDEDGERFVRARDERISAVVALSPPGPMFGEIVEGSWAEQNVPTLVTTGTWDTNAMFWPDWRAHLLSWQTAVAGDQYALVVQGADHYLGNLIGRLDLEGPPQHDALRLVNSTVVAFLDAQFKKAPAALAYLESGQLRSVTGDFAELRRR